jgi:hypothetical protein
MTNSNPEKFKENGYCILRSAISDELRDIITQYALFDEMQDYSADKNQVIGAHSKYADPAMESILLHLHSIMEANTGLTLHPTYSFYRVYRSGDELKAHRDRPSCEISATLCFNYSYNDAEYQWPMYINDHNTAADLRPGDMLIYRGYDLTHWREKFNPPEDSWHVQGFFHYVDVNGPYADYKNDRRDTIGESRTKKATPDKSYITFTQ